MEEIFSTIIGIFLGLLALIAFAAIGSIPMWLLWNWLMPVIFGLTKLTLMQSFGIVLLSGLLFRLK